MPGALIGKKIRCPFTPCGTQSSFAPWLPSGTHAVQVISWYMGPMSWVAPDLSHVGFRYIGPMWEAPDLPHVGFWYMGPMWEAPDLSHVGFWYMGRMWAAQIAPIVHIGCPFSPSGTQSSFAPWHASGAHVGKSCITPKFEKFLVFIDSGVGCSGLLPQIHVSDHLRN